MVIGDNVTIGHQAVVHGCTVGDRTLIGMAATILDGAEIGCDCIVRAGSLVTKHTECRMDRWCSEARRRSCGS